MAHEKFVGLVDAPEDGAEFAVLEKASKNVRANTRNLPFETAQKRLRDYIRRLGFRPKASPFDRFGVGDDQRGLNYNPNTGPPSHELAHALLTPVGESLREHQKKMGNLSTPQSRREMSQEEHRAEEMAAFTTEPQIKRRAGIAPSDFSVANRYNFDSEPENYRAGQKRGVGELNAFEEGRKVIDPKGNVKEGASVDAKINARAAGRPLRKDDPWAVQSSVPAPARPPRTPTRAWAGRSVLDPAHVDELDREAAINEFARRMPRHEAEAKAYEDYVQRQHVEGSAHHLAGIRDARAAGDSEAAQKHAVMYGAHAGKLGRSALAAPEADVLAAMQSLPSKKKKFSPHPADRIAVSPPVISSASVPQPLAKAEVLEKARNSHFSFTAAGVPIGAIERVDPSEEDSNRKIDFTDPVDASIHKRNMRPQAGNIVGSFGGSTQRRWVCNVCAREIATESARWPTTKRAQKAIEEHSRLHRAEARAAMLRPLPVIAIPPWGENSYFHPKQIRARAHYNTEQLAREHNRSYGSGEDVPLPNGEGGSRFTNLEIEKTDRPLAKGDVLPFRNRHPIASELATLPQPKGADGQPGSVHDELAEARRVKAGIERKNWPDQHDYTHLLPQHLRDPEGGGWKLHVDRMPGGKPEVVARMKDRNGLLIGSGWHRPNGEFATSGAMPRTTQHLLAALEEHGRLGKGEEDGARKKPVPCRCERWKFPHRVGSCKSK